MSVGGDVQFDKTLHTDALGQSDVYVGGTVEINTDLSVANNVTINGEVTANNNLFVKGSIFEVPRGNHTQRPTIGVAQPGAIYFNYDTKRFEGLHRFTNDPQDDQWMSLGGVKDIDGDTFISTDNNVLTMYAESSNDERMIVGPEEINIKTEMTNIHSNLCIYGTLSVQTLIAANLITEIETQDVTVQGNLLAENNLRSTIHWMFTVQLFFDRL